MKAIKAIFAAGLTLALVVSMAACTSRNQDNMQSSSVAHSSSAASVAPSTPSTPSTPSAPNSAASHGLASDLGDVASDIRSGVASMVTPTMSTDFDKIGALGGSQIKWGPGVQVDEANRTIAPIGLQEQYGEYSAWFIAPDDCGKFYLTFDEGYENGYTEEILDVLKEKNCSAVFFVTLPYVQSCPELVQRMIDEGHVVGNHTSHHWNPTSKSIDDAAEDIRELHNYVLENFGYEMTLYRPPEGAFSEQTLAMAQSLGYTTCLWSFAYKDYDPNDQRGHDAALAYTEKFIHEGAIYLLHAVSSDNASILGELIDAVRAKGLEVSKWDLPYCPPKS